MYGKFQKLTSEGLTLSPARIAAAGLAIAAIVASIVPISDQPVQAKQVVTAPVERRALDVRVEAKGVVEPVDAVRVSASTAGTVTWAGANVGSVVKRGQVLARITPAPISEIVTASPRSGQPSVSAPLPAATTAAETASRDAAKASVDLARAAYEKAEQQAKKLEAIPDVVPRLQIEDARRKADAAKRAYEAALAQLAVAEKAGAIVSEAKSQQAAASARRSAAPIAPRADQPLAEIVVKAPIDGVVLARTAVAGRDVGSPGSAPALFTIAPDATKVRALVAIAGDEAERLRDGLEVTAAAASLPGRTLEGRVTEVHTSDDASNAATAVVEIASPVRELLPGTSVRVTVSVVRRDDVLTVPNTAFAFDPEPHAAEPAPATPEASGTEVVWVKLGDGSIAPRLVETGATDGDRTEIVAGALGEGELVATADPSQPNSTPDALVDAPSLGPSAEVPVLTFTRTAEVTRLLRLYEADSGRWEERSVGLRERAEQIFREERVPTDLVALAIVESAWQSTAVSPVGATGVWQFMPETARRFGLTVTDTVDDRYDFEKATRAAARYLKFLSTHYDGNWELAIGAYNCGEGAMDQAIADAGGTRDFWTLARGGVLPTETANYVPAVLAASLLTAPAS